MKGINFMILILKILITTCITILNIFNFKIIKFSTKQLFSIILILFIFIAIFINYIEFLGIPIVCATLLIYLYSINKKVIVNILNICLSIMLFAAIDSIVGITFIYTFNVNKQFLLDENIVSLFLHIFVLICNIFFSKLIGIVIEKHKFNAFTYKNNTNIPLSIIMNMVVWVAIFYMYLIMSKEFNLSTKFISISAGLFAVYFISNILITHNLIKTINKKLEYKNKLESIEGLKPYIKSVEELYNDTRKFRHDYVNILSTMNGYIQNDDIEGLKDYFKKHIVPSGRNISEKDSRLGLIKNIKIMSLKGLVASKLIKVQSLNIDIFIDIIQNIESEDLPIYELDLCRIIGIFLDNSIEAAIETPNPKINFGITKSEDMTVLIIANSCKKDNMPPIGEMYQKGFSTKGNNRGMGLSNASEILSKYDNVFLDTFIEDGQFIQKIQIYKKGEN